VKHIFRTAKPYCTFESICDRFHEIVTKSESGRFRLSGCQCQSRFDDSRAVGSGSANRSICAGSMFSVGKRNSASFSWRGSCSLLRSHRTRIRREWFQQFSLPKRELQWHLSDFVAVFCGGICGAALTHHLGGGWADLLVTGTSFEMTTLILMDPERSPR
jgi:hypothetical protein